MNLSQDALTVIALFHVTKLSDIYLTWKLLNKEFNNRINQHRIQSINNQSITIDYFMDQLFKNISISYSLGFIKLTYEQKYQNQLVVTESIRDNKRIYTCVNWFDYYVRYILLRMSIPLTQSVSSYDADYFCNVHQINLIMQVEDPYDYFNSKWNVTRNEPQATLVIHVYFSVYGNNSLGALQSCDSSQLYLLIKSERVSGTIVGTDLTEDNDTKKNGRLTYTTDKIHPDLFKDNSSISICFKYGWSGYRKLTVHQQVPKNCAILL
jgi:hypothetical protein